MEPMNLGRFSSQINSRFQEFTQSRINSANQRPIEYLGPFLNILETHFNASMRRLYQQHMSWLRQKCVGSEDRGQLWSSSELRRMDNSLVDEWQQGRGSIEDFEGIVHRLEVAQHRTVWDDTSNKSQLITEARIRYNTIIQRARKLEVHLREEIQLNVGNLSLEESRKSIQQTNSVGRISFLAFIFFPISIVCSFFGMNIRELNGTGVSWQVFAISAATLSGLILVICIWLWRRSRRLRFILYLPWALLLLIILGFLQPIIWIDKLKAERTKRDGKTRESLFQSLRGVTKMRSKMIRFIRHEYQLGKGFTGGA